MQAWRLTEAAEPDFKITLEEVEPPSVREGYVTIDVAATSVTFVDLLLCQGKHQHKPELPITPGLEVAGTIAEVGAGVTHLAVGQRVMALPELPFGGLAARCLAKASEVFAIPDTLTDVAAAAMLTAYQTSWFALFRRAQLQPGETLLVHAAAGGVGSAAVQLGLAYGSRVIATAGGAEKVDVCKRMGADVVIDYLKDDFVEIVNEVTRGKGANVIYDPVGGEVFDRSRKCIAFEGRLLVIGFASGNISTVKVNHTLLKNYAVMGLFWGLYRDQHMDLIHHCHDELMRLHSEGLVDPLVMKVVAMSDAPAAISSFAGRGTWGRLVVRP
jgi:NADPH2:quinone reductase